MKIILPLFFFCLFSSCAEPTHSHTNDKKHMEEKTEINGRTIEYKYGESIYHLKVTSDSTLSWEAMSGEEKGVTGEETYILDVLETGQIFITWGEENGIGVSQILDFKKGKVYNHLLRGRKADKGYGEIKFLD